MYKSVPLNGSGALLHWIHTRSKILSYGVPSCAHTIFCGYEFDPISPEELSTVEALRVSPPWNKRLTTYTCSHIIIPNQRNKSFSQSALQKSCRASRVLYIDTEYLGAGIRVHPTLAFYMSVL